MAPPPKPPSVRFNYMSTEEDWRGFRAGVRIAREIVAQPAFDGVIGDEITPGAKLQTDAEIDSYLVEHLESAYHPCGTCKMGGSSARMEPGPTCCALVHSSIPCLPSPASRPRRRLKPRRCPACLGRAR